MFILLWCKILWILSIPDRKNLKRGSLSRVEGMRGALALLENAIAVQVAI
ncbi:MAG: hypothetical protein AAGA60_11160 [Cyanobacteria bacterium P01_E01_bin.42]